MISQKHSDVELEKEGDDDLGAEESPEAWKEALISFQEQVLRLQCLSREAYEVHSKKAIEILKETSEQLKIQADKARSDLGVIAKEFTEEGKEYLSTVAVNSPEPVKEIFETYSSSAHDISHFSSARDFHVGIPYGMYKVSQKLTGNVFKQWISVMYALFCRFPPFSGWLSFLHDNWQRFCH